MQAMTFDFASPYAGFLAKIVVDAAASSKVAPNEKFAVMVSTKAELDALTSQVAVVCVCVCVCVCVGVCACVCVCVCVCACVRA